MRYEYVSITDHPYLIFVEISMITIMLHDFVYVFVPLADDMNSCDARYQKLHKTLIELVLLSLLTQFFINSFVLNHEFNLLILKAEEKK